MVQTLNNIRKKIEAMAAASAYAEAGQWKMTENLLIELQEIRNSPKQKIVLVAIGASFSERVIDYAFNLATRLNDNMMVVQIFPRGTEQAQEATPRREANSKYLVADAIRRLKAKAEKMPVRSAHLALWGNMSTVLENLIGHMNGIEMILVQKNPHAPRKVMVNLPMFIIE